MGWNMHVDRIVRHNVKICMLIEQATKILELILQLTCVFLGNNKNERKIYLCKGHEECLIGSHIQQWQRRFRAIFLLPFFIGLTKEKYTGQYQNKGIEVTGQFLFTRLILAPFAPVTHPTITTKFVLETKKTVLNGNSC